MKSFFLTALVALVLGVSSAFLLFGDNVNSLSSHSEQEVFLSDATSESYLLSEIHVAKEKLRVEEILQLTASKERMKWRLREMSEIERLQAAEQIAAITGDEIDTPIEVLIDRVWERWNKASSPNDG